MRAVCDSRPTPGRRRIGGNLSERSSNTDRENRKIVPRKPPRRAELAIIQQLQTYRRALRVAEVADLLHCSDQTVYRLVHENRLPHYLVRGSYRIDPAALSDWLRERYIETA